MIDEFQDLLISIARTGSARDRDTLVLDVLRGNLDGLFLLLTGSVRFDSLSEIVDHRIFGSLTSLRVSFLSEDSVADALRAGLGRWATLPPETVHRVYQLSGGYPWLVQTYGAGLVDRLNHEERAVATPHDVDDVTNEAVLSDDRLFKFWWPTDQLRADEERFIEWLLRKYPGEQPVSAREFWATVNNRELQAFKRAFENLRACEVLDSTQTERITFRGSVLRRWLERQMQDGQLQIRARSIDTQPDRGQAGVFIDHENLLKTVERISSARGISFSSNRLEWLSQIVTNLLSEAEKRLGPVKHRVTAAFWNRPHEAVLLPAYTKLGFVAVIPEEIKMQNAVDFKLADEARRAREQAMRESTWLSRAVLVTGDGDLSHSARALKNDGVLVQIWGGSRETSVRYGEIVGNENVVVLDDVVGL